MDNSITKDVIEKIEELVILAHSKTNLVIEVDGEKYWSKSHEIIYNDFKPKTLRTLSLSSIVDYIKSNKEGYDSNDLFIHVIDQCNVSLFEKAMGKMNQRTCIVLANNDIIKTFRFGDFIQIESFLIGLSTRFLPTEDREIIAKIAGSLRSEKSTEHEDDGATVNYQSSGGIICTHIDIKKIPKVVNLKPFRTFAQVDQPESSFIFRYKKTSNGNIELALFEADGDAWKHTAIDNIKNYFQKAIPKIAVIA